MGISEKGSLQVSGLLSNHRLASAVSASSLVWCLAGDKPKWKCGSWFVFINSRRPDLGYGKWSKKKFRKNGRERGSHIPGWCHERCDGKVRLLERWLSAHEVEILWTPITFRPVSQKCMPQSSGDPFLHRRGKGPRHMISSSKRITWSMSWFWEYLCGSHHHFNTVSFIEPWNQAFPRQVASAWRRHRSQRKGPCTVSMIEWPCANRPWRNRWWIIFHGKVSKLSVPSVDLLWMRKTSHTWDWSRCKPVWLCAGAMNMTGETIPRFQHTYLQWLRMHNTWASNDLQNRMMFASHMSCASTYKRTHIHTRTDTHLEASPWIFFLI